MDHAAWIDRNLWPRQNMSDLGKTVANIIGYVGSGIYNTPIAYDKTNWSDDRYIKVL